MTWLPITHRTTAHPRCAICSHSNASPLTVLRDAGWQQRRVMRRTMRDVPGDLGKPVEVTEYRCGGCAA